MYCDSLRSNQDGGQSWVGSATDQEKWACLRCCAERWAWSERRALRIEQILQMRLAGYTYEQIGARLRISRERAKQILDKELRRGMVTLEYGKRIPAGDPQKWLPLRSI